MKGDRTMKRFAAILGMLAVAFSLSACNTWSGVKQDAKEAGQATGRGLEKAGEKVQEISQ
jgi:predicted small secreted protein